ncbi:OmpW/AlkL family protein [Kushneria aurantia]|uniref:OmpW family protein n=1 Tax=Kushneria aurantia TaxID=504092 RepID=A0ABV6G046_9GAMM|nr:OmpW family outer membrane protein [Kushneria aurantia]
MRKLSILSAAGLVLGATLMTTAAQADSFSYGQGDFYTRLGLAKVAPKSDNGDIGIVADRVDIKDDTGFAFTLGYRFLDKFGVELLAAAPFTQDFDLHGGAGDGLDGSVKHLPPTLTLQFYPLGGTGARVQPYIGAGVNYTHIWDEKVNADGVSLDADDSWGLAGQLGVDLLIDDHWAVNASAWYIDIDSDATVNVGGTNYDTTLNIDPVVVMGGISYRF